MLIGPQMAWCGGVLERRIDVVISGAKTAVVLILQDVEMYVGIHSTERFTKFLFSIFAILA